MNYALGWVAVLVDDPSLLLAFELRFSRPGGGVTPYGGYIALTADGIIRDAAQLGFAGAWERAESLWAAGYGGCGSTAARLEYQRQALIGTGIEGLAPIQPTSPEAVVLLLYRARVLRDRDAAAHLAAAAVVDALFEQTTASGYLAHIECSAVDDPLPTCGFGIDEERFVVSVANRGGSWYATGLPGVPGAEASISGSANPPTLVQEAVGIWTYVSGPVPQSPLEIQGNGTFEWEDIRGVVSVTPAGHLLFSSDNAEPFAAILDGDRLGLLLPTGEAEDHIPDAYLERS